MASRWGQVESSAWLRSSGHRFLVRRAERALLGRDVSSAARAPALPLAIGWALAAVAVAGGALLAAVRPQPRLDHAQILLTQPSGALYVRTGDVWHPVLNLASARLVAATAADPQPVPDSAVARTKRGALLGIPGAPALLGRPLRGDEATWTICDSDGGHAAGPQTTVVVGADPAPRPLDAGQALLVAPDPGSPAYLLYPAGGAARRALVDLADPAVVRALRLEGRTPHRVSQTLLNAVPEASPIRSARIAGAGAAAPAGPRGFAVGTVLRIARVDGDEYYVVLDAGLQRIGQVAADLLRFGDSGGTANAVAVAPDVIRAARIVDSLPVSTYPDRAPAILDDARIAGVVCASWGASDGATLLAGAGLPVPPGGAPVLLSQADGRGPGLDAAYLPPGRVAYVRARGLAPDGGGAGTRYLVTDTGVRFAVADDVRPEPSAYPHRRRRRGRCWPPCRADPS